MFIIPIAATIVTLVLVSAVLGTEAGLLFALPVALITSLWAASNRFKALQRQIDHLSEQLAELKVETPAPASGETVAAAEETAVEVVAETDDGPIETLAETEIPAAAREVAREPAPVAAGMASAANEVRTDAPTRNKNPVDQAEDLIRRIGNAVLSYFTDGNIFVRIGILILFFGVAFLLKYAAENSRIPIEFRFMGAAAGGLFLLAFGWRHRIPVRSIRSFTRWRHAPSITPLAIG